MTRVKVCGITTAADARKAADAGAAAIGVVFAPSPRQVTEEQARRIIDAVPPMVSVVGVFVNAAQSRVLRVLAKCRLQVLQFHGEESDLYCAYFQNYCKIIKAFRVKDSRSLRTATQYSHIDAVLLDAFDERQRGGTGTRFSPGLVRGFRVDKPLIVAGGVTPQNAQEMIRLLRPYALDVSSGVERAAGKKDPRKIAAFMRAVARADRMKD